MPRCNQALVAIGNVSNLNILLRPWRTYYWNYVDSNRDVDFPWIAFTFLQRPFTVYADIVKRIKTMRPRYKSSWLHYVRNLSQSAVLSNVFRKLSVVTSLWRWTDYVHCDSMDWLQCDEWVTMEINEVTMIC